MLAPTQVCISLLSEHDGKGDIVEAAREFCRGIQTKQRALKEMEPDLLNSLLKGNWWKVALCSLLHWLGNYCLWCSLPWSLLSIIIHFRLTCLSCSVIKCIVIRKSLLWQTTWISSKGFHNQAQLQKSYKMSITNLNSGSSIFTLKNSRSNYSMLCFRSTGSLQMIKFVSVVGWKILCPSTCSLSFLNAFMLPFDYLFVKRQEHHQTFS